MLRRPITLAVVIAVAWFGYSYISDQNEDVVTSPRDENVGTQPKTSERSPSNGRKETRRTNYIASVSEVWENSGFVYRVRPTQAGRLADWSGIQQAWKQAVRKGVPNRPHLRQQFLCHPLSIVARGKSSWDLEAWRPEVGLQQTMLAACNPGE